MLITNTIIQIIISLLVISFPVWIILGVVLLVKASGEQDPLKKKKIKKWGVFAVVFPFVALFLVLSIWGMLGILTGTGTVIKQ